MHKQIESNGQVVPIRTSLCKSQCARHPIGWRHCKPLRLAQMLNLRLLASTARDKGVLRSDRPPSLLLLAAGCARPQMIYPHIEEELRALRPLPQRSELHRAPQSAVIRVTTYEYKVSVFQRARQAGRTGGKRTHQRSYRSRIVQEELSFRSELKIEAIELLLLTREEKAPQSVCCHPGCQCASLI